MKTVVAVIAAMLVGAPAFAQSVDVGTAKWDTMPILKAKPSRVDDAELATKVENILRSKQCSLKGQSAKKFDISVPYAVQFDPQGKMTRVLVATMDCKPLEQLVGYVVLARSDAGEYLPTLEGKPRWYASSVNINLQ